MRILYQHRTLGDGAEGIHIIEIIKALRRLGHEVEMVGAPITSSRSRVQKPNLTSAVRRTLPLWMFELAQFVTSGVTYFTMRRKLRSYRPDLIYKRHAKYDFGPILAARHSRVLLILEVNGIYSSPSLRRFEPVSFPRALKSIERWIFSNATENIVVSTPLKLELTDIAPRASVVVMSNGVDHVLFRPNPEAGSQIRARLGLTRQVIVGFVGTLWKWHGLDLLVNAFAQSAKGQDLRLLIVGDGEMRETLEAMTVNCQLTDRVIFAGRVPHEEVAAYVSAMDVTVLPAEHRVHASPMKVIEYMAAAKPVIAPRLPNLSEIITENVDGVLFAEKNVDELAHAISTVATDEQLRLRLGTAARQKVDAELNWDNNAKKVIAIHQRLAGVK